MFEMVLQSTLRQELVSVLTKFENYTCFDEKQFDTIMRLRKGKGKDKGGASTSAPGQGGKGGGKGGRGGRGGGKHRGRVSGWAGHARTFPQ